jgi:hypothetical protein
MRCLYCGTETDGDFCQEHDTSRNRDLLELMYSLTNFKIRGWEYEFFDTFFKLEGYDSILVKAPRGAYKSTVADMVVATLCALYTDMEMLIASVSFPVALQHIRNIKNMVKNSAPFREVDYRDLFIEDSKQQFELSTGTRVYASICYTTE